jgi:hypothetical protein
MIESPDSDSKPGTANGFSANIEICMDNFRLRSPLVAGRRWLCARSRTGLFCCLLSVVWTHFSVANAQTGETVEDLANIDFEADVRLFTVMAALNVAGFDYERPDKEMSDTRQRIRQKLQNLDSQLLEKLQTFYRNHQTGPDEVDNQVSYISLALLLSGPPDFKVRDREPGIPEDVRRVTGFALLVEEFYRKAGIGSLWQLHRSEYELELLRYRPLIKEVIQETLRYFRIPARIALDRRIVLMPDLLNANDIVNARNMEDRYYIAVGPTQTTTTNRRQLQHEYLHFLIDPLVQKFGAVLLKHRNLLELIPSRPQLKPEYQRNLLLVVAESLIESIQLRFHPPDNIDSEMVNLFDRGLILAPYFHRRLQQYEESGVVSLPVYVEIAFKDMVDSEIKNDTETLAALEEKIKVEQEKQLASYQANLQEMRGPYKINSLLREATVLLSEKQYTPARQKLEEILREEPTHGSSFFYLAQIASQTQQYDQAFDYYTRAARSPDIPDWVRGWSVLRIGEHLAFKKEFQKAREKFNQVLDMDGDLQGAREEAQESLLQLPSQTTP